MIRKNPSGDLPVIHESSYVDSTAILCGKIIVEENVFIGPYAVIRADEVDEQGNMEPIIIGANSNIQDGVVIHSKAGGLVKIGTNSSIAHRSIVHGPCIVGENVFIGFNSVLFDCVIGNGSVVRHNSVVEHCEVPENFHIPSTTNVHSTHELSKIPQVSPQASDFSESVLKANHELIKGYKKLQNEF
jgi:carbonic anhydrase/acetyltransferase-like protein (isoleucine patch superfamily)